METKEKKENEVKEGTIALKVDIAKSLHKQLKLRALVMDTTLQELVVSIFEKYVKSKAISTDDL